MVDRRTLPAVRALRADEHREAIAVASRAFWCDPLMDFFAGGDLLREHVAMPAFFRVAMADFQRARPETLTVDVGGRPRGLAVWLPPGTFPRSKRDERRRDLEGIAAFARIKNKRSAIELLLQVDRKHPHEPHWYLGLLATDPSAQGRGVGTALVQPILDRCDAEGMPAYLETQKPENVTWYGRFGFEVVEELRVRDASPIWRLWRDAVNSVAGDGRGKTAPACGSV